MKRCKSFLMACVCFICASFMLPESPEAMVRPQLSQLILPRNLMLIEEDAFAGVPAETIVVQKCLDQVSSRAFAGIHTLEAVYIPPTVRFIAEDAFWNSGLFSIIGVKGSYADDWARRHAIPFVHRNIWISPRKDNRQDKQGLISRLSNRDISNKSVKQIIHLNRCQKSQRPQDRSELHVIDYWFP